MISTKEVVSFLGLMVSWNY